ncbi:MAG: methyltransferase [Acidobacteria bacterium]|nr:methyltransferase [Acidobacteriota bacterium]
MKLKSVIAASLAVVFTTGLWAGASAESQSSAPGALDTQVRQFLDSRRWSWRDMNVPEADGQEMHHIIVERKYKNAVEIGTSTGHSGIWIAWALSKTGGRLITIDIDPERHREAVANFKAAGVAPYIDLRLGDAHEIVPALQRPIDFVFSDADKNWYINYAKAVLPKISVGGCLVTHNVSERGWGQGGEYLRYLRSLSFLDTTLFTGGGGMSISHKRAAQ